MKLNRVKIAYEQGYRVINGEVFSEKGKKVKMRPNDSGYLQFSYRVRVRYLPDGCRKVNHVSVHRLVAFQKYGDSMFSPGILVRHKDNNCLNNLPDNILIGTHQDNMMDKPISARVSQAVRASTHIRVLSDEDVAAVKRDRANGLTYPELVAKYHLSGKGQAHYIVNHNYVTKISAR